VDGNNLGPSYIRSFGKHTGGELWTEDQGVIDCHGAWKKFDGKKLHETQPFGGTRISFIVFTHNACEELTSEVVGELRALGFTAGDTCRQRDPGNVDESDFDASFAAHRLAHPPPVGKGMVAVECAGYACGRGVAWVSYDAGPGLTSVAKGSGKASASKDSAGKPPSSGRASGLGLTGGCSTLTTVSQTVQVCTFEKNRVGLHVVELELADGDGEGKAGPGKGYLRLVARRRFDLYNRDEAASEFATWVGSLRHGTVVVVTISDTAIAKKRPMGEPVFAALRLLGAARDMEVIGYRNPFVFVGAKGLAEGEAATLLDKRAQSKTVLRLDARIVAASVASVATFSPRKKGTAPAKTTTDHGPCPVAITEVKNSSIRAQEMCPDREKDGYVFKNCQTVKKC
jgi:hypothetical protein